MGAKTAKAAQFGGETAGTVAVAYMIAILVVPYIQIPEGFTSTTLIGAMTAGISAIIRFAVTHYMTSAKAKRTTT